MTFIDFPPMQPGPSLNLQQLKEELANKWRRTAVSKPCPCPYPTE
jgi:hypothetical protein